MSAAQRQICPVESNLLHRDQTFGCKHTTRHYKHSTDSTLIDYLFVGCCSVFTFYLVFLNETNEIHSFIQYSKPQLALYTNYTNIQLCSELGENISCKTIHTVKHLS